MSGGAILFGTRWPPETVCKSPLGFVAAIASRLVSRGGLGKLEAWRQARETFRYMLPECGGKFGHSDFSWTVGDAVEWADTEMSYWEASP